MDLGTISKLAQASDSVSVKPRQPESNDPIKALMLPGVSAHNPPGALSEFCEIIGKHFEYREDCEMYRIVGALCAAQVIAGRNVLTPTRSKAMLQLMLVATSGSGKSSSLGFVSAVAKALGVGDRYRDSVVTSLKQLQMAIVEADGALVYVADDNPTHVLNWDNERSPLDGVSSFFRANSSSSEAWRAPSPIRQAFDEILATASSQKMLEAKARAEGWLLPRVDGTKEINFKEFARMKQDVAVRFAEAKRHADMAEKPIERIKMTPVIMLTPESGVKIMRNWIDNGTMGRTFFVYKDGEKGKARPIPEKWNPTSFVNQWRPRMPSVPMTGKWGPGAQDRFAELSEIMDSMRNDGGIVGNVSSRYSQMMIDLATLCAFIDPVARSVSDFQVNVDHIEWAYQACLESIVAMRDYAEGDPGETGLEADEWVSLVGKIRACAESSKFQANPTIAVMVDRVCRTARVKTIISACVSARLDVTKEKFIYILIECISQYRHAPIEIDPENPSRLRMVAGGSWDDVPMNNTVRDMLSKALAKMKFIKTVK